MMWNGDKLCQTMVSDAYKLESNGQVKSSIYQTNHQQGRTQIENSLSKSWIKHNASLRKVCEKLNKHILEYVHPIFFITSKSYKTSDLRQVINIKESVQHQNSLKAVVSLNCTSIK